MIRFKLGDTAHEAMISLMYFMTAGEADAVNTFDKAIWKVEVNRIPTPPLTSEARSEG